MLTSDFRHSHTLLSIADLIEAGVLDSTMQPTRGRVIVSEKTLMPVKEFRVCVGSGITVTMHGGDKYEAGVDDKRFFCVYQQ